MKVLVVTPVYKQFGPAILSWAKAFRYLMDNQPDIVVDHLLQYNTPPEVAQASANEIILAKYRAARQTFLAGSYDVMVTLEDDMIIPENGLSRLLAVDADVAYGLYVWRYMNSNWSSYIELDDQGGRSLSYYPEKLAALVGADGQPNIVNTLGVGLGFTAIQRRVLRKIDFTLRGDAANDWYFASDAAQAGFVQRHDLGLICGHATKTPTPRIYWPDPTEKEFVRVEFL